MKKEQFMLDALEEISQRLCRIEEKLSQPGILSGKWLSQQEVCDELHVTKRTLANYRNKGILKFTRLGKKILYQSDALNKPLLSKPGKKDNAHPVSRKT